jgi:hypothetical protein
MASNNQEDVPFALILGLVPDLFGCDKQAVDGIRRNMHEQFQPALTEDDPLFHWYYY